MLVSKAKWVGPPRSFTVGRPRMIQFVVIHTTEGGEGTSSAEAGAAYDKTRTDGTSTHLFVDADSALREVQNFDRAHHARHHGNEIGVGVELCGRAGQTIEQWHDPASSAMLKLAAHEVAVLVQQCGLSVRRLSVAEVRAAYYADPAARPFGICGHIDVTKAFPEDHGTHTDPGPAFPWAEFLTMVNAELEADAMSDPLAGYSHEAELDLIAHTIDTGKRGPGRSDTAPDGAGGSRTISWLVRSVEQIQASLARIEANTKPQEPPA